MRIVISALLLGLPGAVLAQDFDGLYRPDESWAAGWRCTRDFLGADGGALGILDGQLFGVENTCDLSNQRPDGNAVRYTAICSSEGESYTTEYLIRSTPIGISLTRDGETVAWRRCDQPSGSTPTNTWTTGFAMGVTEAWTEDDRGNRITFSCSDGSNGQLHVDLNGRPAGGGPITFIIDDQTYSMTVWAEGGRVNVECTACASTYAALQQAVAAGNMMTIEHGGASVSMSLRGSAAALGPDLCVPEGW